MYLGTMKGWIKHYFRFYSGSTKVLPGPPKYLLHQCPPRARPVPEIVPEIVPDPPLHSAQSILAFRKKDFYVFLSEMYLGTMKGWIGIIYGFYSGSTKVLPGPPKYLPHQCSQRARLEIVPEPPLHSAQIIPAFRKKDFYVC